MAKCRSPLTYQRLGPRDPRVIDPDALKTHVVELPDQPSASVLLIFKFPSLVLGIGCANSASREKKRIGYKERCDDKRQTYVHELDMLKAAGKLVVYTDESGFRQESHRGYTYAPRGECVLGLISSQRTRTTTLLAAR